jgi:hypothetical protein
MPALPTIQVRIRASGQGPVTINADDFREELHERWEHTRQAPAAEPEPAPAVEEVVPGPTPPGKKRKG